MKKCLMCGKNYIPTTIGQKYCGSYKKDKKSCSYLNRIQNIILYRKTYYKENKTAFKKRALEYVEKNPEIHKIRYQKRKQNKVYLNKLYSL